MALYGQLLPVLLVPPALRTADVNSLGNAGFSTRGKETLIVVSVGTSAETLSGSIRVDFVLADSDNNSTFTNVPDIFIDSPTLVAGNAGIMARIDANAELSNVYVARYKGTRPFLRVFCDTVGLTTGVSFGVIALPLN